MSIFDISILTTCLNEQKDIDHHVTRLHETIKGHNIRFLLIDGGSTDATSTILKSRLPDSCWEILPKSSIYQAWNHAIKRLTNTNYYCFLGVGDILLNQGLEESMQIIQQTKPDIIYGPTILGAKKISHNPPDKVTGWMWGHLPFCHAGTLFSRKLFLRYGLFDESYNIAGDLDWLLRIRSLSEDEKQPITYSCSQNELANLATGGISTQLKRINQLAEETYRAHHSNHIRISTKRRLYLEARRLQAALAQQSLFKRTVPS